MTRPKGVPNRVHASVKDNVLAVFNRLGGTHAMAKWAKRHQSEFYGLYARLLPKQIEATVESTTTLVVSNADSLTERLTRALVHREGEDTTVQ